MGLSLAIDQIKSKESEKLGRTKENFKTFFGVDLIEVLVYSISWRVWSLVSQLSYFQRIQTYTEARPKCNKIVTILRFCLGSAAVQNKVSSVSWPIDENNLSAIWRNKLWFQISVFIRFKPRSKEIRLTATYIKHVINNVQFDNGLSTNDMIQDWQIQTVHCSTTSKEDKA